MSQKNDLNIGVMNLAFFLMSVLIIGWMLYIGRDLLIPLVLALGLWYILNGTANYLQKFLSRWVNIPSSVAMIGAFIVAALVSMFVIDMVAQNAVELSKQMPTYQANIETKIKGLVSVVAPHADFNLDQVTKALSPQKILGWATSLASSMLAVITLVAIYLLFIFFETSVFDKKFNALFDDPDKRAHANQVRERIMHSIGVYLTVKTFVSMLTGFISAVVLYLVGVDYPVFWGFITFLLNYIPNIGSMLAVLFPALLSLVQFNTTWQFFVVAIGLGLTQFTIGNLIEPRLMGNSLNLSGLVILLALAVWGSMWGITGMVLSVPITVAMMIIFSQFQITRPLAILLSSDGKVD